MVADHLTLTVDTNSVQYCVTENAFGFEIELDQELASGHSIKGVISGEGGLSPSSLIQSKSTDRHLWNLVLPGLIFDANLMVDGRGGKSKISFQGNGYHDHNIGYEPMKNSFRDWYWGRYHFEDMTIIYYLMNKHESQQFEGWLIDRQNQSVLTYFSTAELEYYSRNWFGLHSARKIELKTGEVTVNIQCRNKIDDGPFYQRFLGDSILRYNDQIYVAQGISEYIYPKNIHKKMFWPLVHMRLRYMKEKPHWVQKSRLMYPWTW
jgi:carotenoid 1,2-hydratase